MAVLVEAPCGRQSEATSPAAVAAPLILVADDVADNREMYAEYLRFRGYRVVTADDGKAVLEEVQRARPDLVVLDLTLPRVDGWEVARRLKADHATKTIPVLVVTAHALEGAERAARLAGADAYLPKPCLPDRLTDAVAELLQRRQP